MSLIMHQLVSNGILFCGAICFSFYFLRWMNTEYVCLSSSNTEYVCLSSSNTEYTSV
jgi:hypothetical protein